MLFSLKQELKKGARLKLSLPLPRSMQKAAASKPVYETEAVVVRIEATDDPGTRRVAVRFRSASSKAYYQESPDWTSDNLRQTLMVWLEGSIHSLDSMKAERLHSVAPRP